MGFHALREICRQLSRETGPRQRKGTSEITADRSSSTVSPRFCLLTFEIVRKCDGCHVMFSASFQRVLRPHVLDHTHECAAHNPSDTNHARRWPTARFSLPFLTTSVSSVNSLRNRQKMVCAASCSRKSGRTTRFAASYVRQAATDVV